ncbi:nucleotide exchange factor GrpE [Candidatus Liberibacter solanacearum]|uniref:Protein GrpE n=2 Tax=Candidatus Liberibacter solanacearum TaxID=556287 RepID=A0A1V2N8N8_9HYPH|nr:nucleotide exchange factor GrpE [Candidatus Liberibacter solanacearum]ONI60041.1 nucleotide exchange factor GrpE [Candidatus Liberibacter solanacearum]
MSEKENNHSNTNEDSVEEKINNNPLEEAQAKAEEFREKYLRVLADMENIRRRTDREIQDSQSYSIAAFARDMLSVSDNLSRALNSVPIDKTQNSDSEIKSLIDGIEMTRREMMSTLEKYGVKKIDAKNQKFNPNIHQAMFEESNETIPSNTVIKVVQDGYAIGERILRPALVGISKGKNKNPVE